MRGSFLVHLHMAMTQRTNTVYENEAIICGISPAWKPAAAFSVICKLPFLIEKS